MNSDFNTFHAPANQRLLLALALIAGALLGTLALFSPYPMLAPAMIIAVVIGLFVIRFPELAIYGMVAGIFFTGGNNPLSIFKIHGMIKLGSVLILAWAIARTISSEQTRLSSTQKLALGFGALYGIYAVASWVAGPYPIQHPSILIVQRTIVSICLFSAIILLQDRLKLHFLLLAICAGAGASALLSLPFDTAHVENGREAGFLGDPNLYSAYLVASVPLTGYLIFENKHPALRAAALVLLLCILFVLVKTSSRAGTVAGALGIAAIILANLKPLLRNWQMTAPIAAIAAIGTLVVAAPVVTGVFDRSDSTEVMTPLGEIDRSTARRLSYIRVGTEMIAKRPVLGNGFGTFPTTFANSTYSKVFMTSKEVFPLYRRAHNSYLEVMAELGLLGFFLFGGVHFLSGLSVLGTLRRSARGAASSLSRIGPYLGASLACIWIMMLTLSIQEMYLVWTLCAICLLAPTRSITGAVND